MLFDQKLSVEQPSSQDHEPPSCRSGAPSGPLSAVRRRDASHFELHEPSILWDHSRKLWNNQPTVKKEEERRLISIVREGCILVMPTQ